MNASQTQIRTHRYLSGWCEAARHDRCKGSYAGTACNCSCHRQVPLEGVLSSRGLSYDAIDLVGGDWRITFRRAS